MRICGVDPGLQTTGYGVVESRSGNLVVLDAGTIRPDRAGALADRLHQIHADLCTLLEDTRPRTLVVENVYSHYRHPQTAVLMGHVRGIILQVAAAQCLAVVEVPATRVKRLLTGNGRASKDQMQRAVQVRLGLPRPPEPHDVADALALAIAGAESRRGADLIPRGGPSR